MEPLFEVVARREKEHYRALTDYSLKKQKNGVILLVFSLLIAVCALCNALLMQPGTMVGVLLTCGFISLLYGLQPRSLAKASWDARNPLLDGAPVTFRFDDTYFYDNHPLTASTADYRTLMDVVETEEYFLLYISKASAYILPKAAFTKGTPEAFRTFIAQKLGRPVTAFSQKKEHGRRLRWALLVPLLALVLSVALLLVGNVNHVITVTSENGNEVLSMEVPLYLTWEDKNAVGATELYSEEVAVVVWHYDTAYLTETLQGEELTPQAYMDYLYSTGYIEGDNDWQTDSNGNYYLSNYYQEYYYLTCLYWTDNACFLVEFSCLEENTLTYAHQFEEWRESITVEVME